MAGRYSLRIDATAAALAGAASHWISLRQVFGLRSEAEYRGDLLSICMQMMWSKGGWVNQGDPESSSKFLDRG